MLAEDFPGVEALRVQRETVRVKGVWRGRGGIVLLDVGNADAPRAEVRHTVPVETRVRGADPPEELLLFVKDGLLDSIELVKGGGEEPLSLPDVSAVEPPTVSV